MTLLIIAIPKSASTSLLDTLGQLHRLPAKQLFFKDYAIPSGLRLLPRYHSDLREIGEQEADLFCQPDSFHKQHLPPSPNNLRLLAEKKKVVLLRAPKQIIAAYYRAEQRNIHDPRQEFAEAKSAQEWEQAAEQNGLLQDLNWFYDTWQREAEAFPQYTLALDYEELLENPTSVVNQLEVFFNLPRSAQVILAKKRYTRHNRFRQILIRLHQCVDHSLYLFLRKHPGLHRLLSRIKRIVVKPNDSRERTR